jgi:hypothetical protein
LAATTISARGKVARIAPMAGVVMTASPIQLVCRTRMRLIFAGSMEYKFLLLFKGQNLESNADNF